MKIGWWVATLSRCVKAAGSLTLAMSGVFERSRFAAFTAYSGLRVVRIDELYLCRQQLAIGILFHPEEKLLHFNHHCRSKPHSFRVITRDNFWYSYLSFIASEGDAQSTLTPSSLDDALGTFVTMVGRQSHETCISGCVGGIVCHFNLAGCVNNPLNPITYLMFFTGKNHNSLYQKSIGRYE
ncbi:hypothetical protein TNCV_3686781 [Trichonephila clavipes]|nr:hypothetical protein TNCV_3686781 [Trichonephila clavipes]